ncbi:hypothetical protein EV361DRAFT_954854 [Lentinula raphanica]|nr:hypothetical protein EV361DRAFT_954854 [Lentinula raphanica]
MPAHSSPLLTPKLSLDASPPPLSLPSLVQYMSSPSDSESDRLSVPVVLNAPGVADTTSSTVPNPTATDAVPDHPTATVAESTMHVAESSTPVAESSTPVSVSSTPLAAVATTPVANSSTALPDPTTATADPTMANSTMANSTTANSTTTMASGDTFANVANAESTSTVANAGAMADTTSTVSDSSIFLNSAAQSSLEPSLGPQNSTSVSTHVPCVEDSENNPFLSSDQVQRPFVLKYHRTPDVEALLASSAVSLQSGPSLDKRKFPLVDDSIQYPSSSKRLRMESSSYLHSFNLPTTPPLLVVNGVRFLPDTSTSPSSSLSVPLSSSVTLSSPVHIDEDEFSHLDIDLPTNLDDVPGLEIPSSPSLPFATTVASSSTPAASSSTPLASYSTPVASSSTPVANYTTPVPSTPHTTPDRSRTFSDASKYCMSLIDAALKSQNITPSPSRLSSPLQLPPSSSSSLTPLFKTPRTPGSAYRLSMINQALQEPVKQGPAPVLGTFTDPMSPTNANVSHPMLPTNANVSHPMLPTNALIPTPTLKPIAADSFPCEDQDYLSISTILASLQLHERRSLMASTTFVQSGGWFNPARADPSSIKTVTNDKRATFMSPVLRPHLPAMCLSVGVVERCSIVNPSKVNLNNGNVRTTHEALIKGFSQEEQRKLAFLATVLGFSIASIPASAGVIVYSSMQRFDGESENYKRLLVRNRPPRYVPGDSRLKIYPQFRVPTPFTSQIPIFDGRRGSDTAFECDANQLHEISINSYPLYQNGDTDLPPGSLVAVGYTVHTYHPKSGDGPICLSFNLAFLVLLALPPNLPSRYYLSAPSSSPSVNTSPFRQHSSSSSAQLPAVSRHYIDLTTLSTGEVPTTPK